MMRILFVLVISLHLVHGACVSGITFNHFTQPASLDSSGDQCIGVSSEFASTLYASSNLTASPVQTITITSYVTWVNPQPTPNMYYVGFQLSFFDGTSSGFNWSGPNYLGVIGSYTFSTGEFLTSMTMCADSNWNPTGVSFTTQRLDGTTGNANLCNQSLTTQSLSYSGINGSQINGLFTYNGWTLGAAFSISRKIVSVNFGNITYPTLGYVQSGLNPVTIGSVNFCNNGNTTISENLSYSQTTGTNTCWTDTTEYSMNFKIGGSVEVPEVFSINGESSWGMKQTSSTNSCNSTLVVTTMTTIINIAPNTTGVVTVTQWDSLLADIPFTGTYEVTFDDGSSNAVAVSGTYSGAYLTAAVINSDSKPLQPGQTCNGTTITTHGRVFVTPRRKRVVDHSEL